MASIIYASSASVYSRVIGRTGLSEMHIDVLPDMVLVLTGSYPNTSSVMFIQGYDTGSIYPITASWVLTASYSTNGGGGGADYIGNQVFS